MSRQLFEEARKVLTQEAAVKLDPVGQEDKDVDNDGDADKTDSYLKKRRGAISSAIAKSKNESALSEEDLAKLKSILGEMKKKEEMENEEEDDEDDDEKEMKKEEVEQVDEMQVANKYALKGPQPAVVPAYMRKGNARKQFPVKLDDLKRKDTMSDIENLRKMEEVEGVAEGKKADRYHIVAKDGKPASLASYADRDSAVKDRDAKYPGAVVQQVGPRGKVKGVAEGAMSDLDADRKDRQYQSRQAKTTMKHISNPTAGEKKAAKDIKPGIAGYRDRIDMLKSAEARGGLKKEEAEQEDFELIEKLNFEVPENPSYQDYFKAALKMAQVESFAELDDEDQQYIMNEMENAFRQNDTSFILEADMMGDMNDTVQRLRKAGHKVEDMGRDFKGNPFYVYIDKGSSMRRKVTYKGTQKVTQNMGKAQPEKEEE